MSANGRAAKRKALVVGISDYTSLQQLDFCKNDDSRHPSYRRRNAGRALGCDPRRSYPGAVKERPSHVRGQVSRVRSGF